MISYLLQRIPCMRYLMNMNAIVIPSFQRFRVEGRKRFEYATCAPVFFRKRRIKSPPFSTTSGSVWTGPHFVSAYLHSHPRCKKCFYHRVTKETVVVPGALLGPEISVAFSSRKFHRCCTGKSVKARMKSDVIQETQQKVTGVSPSLAPSPICSYSNRRIRVVHCLPQEQQS